MGEDDAEKRKAAYHKALSDMLPLINSAFDRNSMLSADGMWHEGLRDELSIVFAPVLALPEMQDHLVWFNCFFRSIRGKPATYCLKHDMAEDQRVMNFYIDTSKAGHTLSPSKVSEKISARDCAFLYWRNDKPEQNGIEYSNYDFRKIFLPLQACKVEPIVGQNIEIGSDRIVEAQLASFNACKRDVELINLFKQQMQAGWSLNGTKPISSAALNDDLVAQLINYYVWVRRLYREDWSAMAYLPGITGADHDSVPFGINVGFRTQPSANALLFLQHVSLKFFTRLAVDYYVAEAKKSNDAARIGRESKAVIKEIVEQLDQIKKFRTNVEKLQMIIDTGYNAPGWEEWDALRDAMKNALKPAEVHNILDHQTPDFIVGVLDANIDKIGKLQVALATELDKQLRPAVRTKLFSPWSPENTPKKVVTDKRPWLPAVALAKKISEDQVPLAWLKEMIGDEFTYDDWKYGVMIGQGDNLRVRPTRLCSALRGLRTGKASIIIGTVENNKFSITINMASDGDPNRKLADLKMLVEEGLPRGNSSRDLIALVKSVGGYIQNEDGSTRITTDTDIVSSNSSDDNYQLILKYRVRGLTA